MPNCLKVVSVFLFACVYATATPSYCVPDADGHYPGEAIKIDQKGTVDGVVEVHGGGCILRPLSEAWAASKQEAAMRFERSTLMSVEPVGDRAFDARYKAGPALFAVYWTMRWTHTVVGGTAAAPQQILVDYQKTEGTQHIPIWKGTIVLTRLHDGVTEIAVEDTIQADQTGPDESEGTVRNFIEELRTL